jgi:hypothetical protein
VSGKRRACTQPRERPQSSHLRAETLLTRSELVFSSLLGCFFLPFAHSAPYYVHRFSYSRIGPNSPLLLQATTDQLIRLRLPINFALISLVWCPGNGNTPFHLPFNWYPCACFLFAHLSIRRRAKRFVDISTVKYNGGYTQSNDKGQLYFTLLEMRLFKALSSEPELVIDPRRDSTLRVKWP